MVRTLAHFLDSRTDIWLAPVYDMLTTAVYDDYAKNPPGLSLGGRSTWTPGKSLEIFLQTRCNVRPAQLKQRIERICEAVVSVTPEVIGTTKSHPHFYETGKRMLHAWNEGMNNVRLKKSWSLPSLSHTIHEAKFSAPEPAKATAPEKIGRSPLLAPK
jgi:serine/threonine-protein kinase HipA